MILNQRYAAVCILALSLTTLALTGCGNGARPNGGGVDLAGTELHGYTYGGPNPILGSTVNLFTTGFNTDGGGTVYPVSATKDGYGVATLRSTTTSSAIDGTFSLPGGYTCPAHQFLYLTSSGGNTGGNTTTAGAGASGTAQLGVVSYTVTNAGSGFTATPTVAVDAPTSGTTATGTPKLTGTSVASFTLLTAGTTYSTVPTVAVNVGGGSGATGTAVLSGGTSGTLTGITLTAGGSGYTSTPNVVISGGGATTEGTATVVLTPTTIASVAFATAGSGYTSIPNFTVMQTGATSASGTTALGVAAITLTSAGTGYSNIPSVSITASDGVFTTAGVATAAVSNNALTGFNVTTAGTGYDAVPNVAVTSGSTTGNAGATLVAALGRCEDLFDSGGSFSATGGYTGPGLIYINELTTVAAAYALGGFTTETGINTSTIVRIGAPATNNSRYTVSGFSTGCVTGFTTNCGDATLGNNNATANVVYAAGLLHAFQNALDLVSPNTPPVNGSSSALTTLASNTAAVLPTAMVNTLANSMVACVNSTGNNSPACNTFLQTGGASGAQATDVFAAMRYIALNPSLTGAGQTSVATFVNNCTSPTCVYAPVVSGTVRDLSVAIIYPSGTQSVSGNQAFTAILGAGLDVNDDLYISNGNAAQSTSTVGDLFSFSSNGTQLGATGNNSSTLGDASLTKPASVALDPYFNVYVIPYASTTVPLVRIPTSGGVFGTPINLIPASGVTKASQGAVVDKFGNIFFTNIPSNGFVNMYRYAAQPIASTLPTSVGPVSYSAQSGSALGIDPNQNIWVANGQGGGGTGYVVVNNGGVTTASPPSYSTTGLGLASTYSSGWSFGAANASPFYFAMSIDGNFTTVGTTKYTVTAGGTLGFGIASTAKGTAASDPADSAHATGTGAGYPIVAVDGNNTVWQTATVSATGFGLTYLPQNSSNSYTSNTGGLIQPCYLATCTNPFGSFPAHVLIDSTGTVWTDSGTGGNLIQIIGTAAPAEPLLYSGFLGKP